MASSKLNRAMVAKARPMARHKPPEPEGKAEKGDSPAEDLAEKKSARPKGRRG